MNSTNNKHTLQLLSELKALKNLQMMKQKKGNFQPSSSSSRRRSSTAAGSESNRNKNPLTSGSSHSQNQLLRNSNNANNRNYFQRQGSSVKQQQQQQNHRNSNRYSDNILLRNQRSSSSGNVLLTGQQLHPSNQGRRVHRRTSNPQSSRTVNRRNASNSIQQKAPVTSGRRPSSSRKSRPRASAPPQQQQQARRSAVSRSSTEFVTNNASQASAGKPKHRSSQYQASSHRSNPREQASIPASPAHTNNSAAQQPGSNYLQYLSTYMPSSKPASLSHNGANRSQPKAKKHQRQPSFSIEERADQIIRSTDERILSENGIEISPIKKRGRRSQRPHSAAAMSSDKPSHQSNGRKRTSISPQDSQSTSHHPSTNAMHRKSSHRSSSNRQQGPSSSRHDHRDALDYDEFNPPSSENDFETRLSKLEHHEQRLEDEINDLNAQLANKSTFVSVNQQQQQSSRRRKKQNQRPQSAFALRSHHKRTKSTNEDYFEDNHQKYKHIPLDIDLQIEKHRQRLRKTGIRRRHSAVMRSRSVDRSRSRSANRSSFMSARLLELSKPKIRKSDLDDTSDEHSKHRNKRKEKRSQSVPRLRPYSTTKLFGSPKYYENQKTPSQKNIPTIDAEAVEAKRKKTPMVSVHLKHLLIGAAEIQRVQQDIRSEDEQMKKQQHVTSSQVGGDSFTEGAVPQYSTTHTRYSSRAQSPTTTTTMLGGSNADYPNAVNTRYSDLHQHQQQNQNRPSSAPPRQVENQQPSVAKQSAKNRRSSYGPTNSHQATQGRYSSNDFVPPHAEEHPHRRNSYRGTSPAAPSSQKSSLQQLVEQKLLALQNTMKNISKSESKYRRNVGKMAKKLNNSMRQSISSTGSYDFSRARESNLFSASLENARAQMNVDPQPAEDMEMQSTSEEDSTSDENSTDDSDFEEGYGRFSAQQQQQQRLRPQSSRARAPNQNTVVQSNNPLLKRHNMQQAEHYNPLLSPNQDPGMDDLVPPVEQDSRRPIQRNTPLFAGSSVPQQQSKYNSRPRSRNAAPNYYNLSHQEAYEYDESDATTNNQPFSVANLMLNREREMNGNWDDDVNRAATRDNTIPSHEESFNTRFNRLREKIIQ